MFAPAPPRPPVGRLVAAGTLLLAALAGAADAGLRAGPLGAADALRTMLAWLGLALVPALVAGLAAALLARLGRAGGRLALVVLGLEVVAGGFAACALGLVALPTAAGLAAAALVAAALLPAEGRGMRRLPGGALGVVAALVVLVVAVAALRSAPSLRGPAAGSASAPAVRARAVDGGPRHVVLVVLDTQRADFLGAYGAPGDPTPVFDRLAAQGTLYEDCYAPASWTVPSHASLFTGLPPRMHGASFLYHRWLDDRFTTLAESFRAAGFATAGFAANEHLALANLHQGFEVWRTLAAEPRSLAVHRPLQWLGFPARLADDGAGSAASEIGSYLRNRPQPLAPTFLFVNLLEPHWRYLPPLPARLGAAPGPLALLRATAFGARFYGPLAMAGAPLPAGGNATLRALYAAEVRYQDAAFGRLLETLDATLGLDDTLLLVTADHGENLGEAGRYDHVFAINDHLVHVPLVIREPGAFPAGARETGLCSLQDVPATLADVVPGLEIGPGRGSSLRPGRREPHARVYAEGDPFYGHLERMSLAAGLRRDVAEFTPVLRSVRDDRFKWVASSRGGGALYEPASDPDETRDVQELHPDRAAALAADLAQWKRETPVYVRDDADAGRGLDATERARLEALGYVQ